MIEADKREAVNLLHKDGMPLRAIARQLRISRTSVRTIVEQKGAMPQTVRSDKILVDQELLSRLYGECEGWIQRVYEKLIEEEGLQIEYSTLTRLLRELGISGPSKTRCDRVPDVPGAEMQHDTSPFKGILLGDKRVNLIASVLYMRYSKRRYLKFYRVFNRFTMKCFLYEALMYWGYAARECIIDNTNLARLRGLGKNAVIVPEMEAFAAQYGYRFCCHEKNHANRKAGEERSFYTLETNFFPGRRFAGMEDINLQAFEWSTVRMDNRQQGNTRLIPAKAFEHECGYLVKLPPHLPPPYLQLERGTDQYGYVSFDGNYYWVPGTKRDGVIVLQYSDRIKIYQNRICLIEYALPAPDIKNQPFSPQGLPKPRYQPHNRKKPTHEEERRLRAISESVNRYLDFVLKTKDGLARHRVIRELFALTRQMTAELFIKTVERALRYQIAGIATLRRIAWHSMNHEPLNLPNVDVDQSFCERDAYREGHLTDAPDFSIYDKMLEG
jgi:transposase